jgi:hypothetical protein
LIIVISPNPGTGNLKPRPEGGRIGVRCVPNRLPDLAATEAVLLDSDRRTCNKA